MANKKISEFPVTTTLNDDDVFLIDHLKTTSTINYSSLKENISGSLVSNINNTITSTLKISASQILPSNATNGQVLTYDASTLTWKPSAVNSTTTNYGNIWAYIKFKVDTKGNFINKDNPNVNWVTANNVLTLTRTTYFYIFTFPKPPKKAIAVGGSLTSDTVDKNGGYAPNLEILNDTTCQIAYYQYNASGINNFEINVAIIC